MEKLYALYYILVSICVTFECLIHIQWLAPWNVYFQQLNPLNVYIQQFNHGMYTFHSLSIECIHSTVLAIECIHSTVSTFNATYILNMLNFKKLALKATNIQDKISVETLEMATKPISTPPAIFQKWAGCNQCHVHATVQFCFFHSRPIHKQVRHKRWAGDDLGYIVN